MFRFDFSRATGFRPLRFLVASLLTCGLLLSLAGCVKFYHAQGGGFILSPVARSGASAVAVGGSIYLAGGQTLDEMGADGGSFRRSVVRAPVNPDGSLGSWVEQPPLDFPRGYGTLLHHDGALYFIGGYKDFNPGSVGIISSVLRAAVNPGGDLAGWTEVGSISIARGAAAVVNNSLVMMGGISSGGSASDSVMRYPMAPEGTLGLPISAGKLAYPRNRFAIATSPHGIFVLGGYRGGFPYSYDDSVERLMWSEGAPQLISQMQPRMPSRRGGHAAVTVGDHLIVVGGYTGFHHLDRIDVAIINPNGELSDWRQAGTLKEPRSNLAVAVQGGNLYVLGGGSTAGLSSAVEVIPLKQLGL